MNIKNIALSIVLASSTATGIAQTTADSPMSRAVMSVYDKMIEENPADYETLFARGSEYYNQDDYIKALDDINSALRYAPENAKDLRFGAYRLRAAINERQHRFNDAYNDINSALAIFSESPACIQQQIGRAHV